MIAVIFEFTPLDGRFAGYKSLAEGLAQRAQAPGDSVKVHG